MMLSGKTVVLGVTGSIAAFKAADLASTLAQTGADVDVVMTEAATEFITPATFGSLTHRPVLCDLFEPPPEYHIEHIALAERANIMVIAPATASTIAKMAVGIADNLLTCVALATRAPIVVAPAMNVSMLENTATQDNLARLRERGVTIIDPEEGVLACGATGAGRLANTERIINTIYKILGTVNDLEGIRLVVTAGGTQEPIDPVRHIANRSSGKMGYAIAATAKERGAMVTLVTAPTTVPIPVGVETRHVQTALEMRHAVIEATAQADAIIMAAAVADYRPSIPADSKLKRDASSITLGLVQNPDILSEVKRSIVRIGFAAESENLVENASQKVKEKKLDLIVANDITAPGCGFGSDTNKVVLVTRRGKTEELPLLPKTDVAMKILDRLVEILAARKGVKE